MAILRQRRPQGAPTDDEVHGTAAATVMTSAMIKNSLQELRSKLETMKRNKEAVESGIHAYESKY